MNQFSFGLHTLLEITDETYQFLREKVGARRAFFDHIRTLATYLDFENWRHLPIDPTLREKKFFSPILRL